jgi:hypothetical protein
LEREDLEMQALRYLHGLLKRMPSQWVLPHFAAVMRAWSMTLALEKAGRKKGKEEKGEEGEEEEQEEEEQGEKEENDEEEEGGDSASLEEWNHEYKMDGDYFRKDGGRCMNECMCGIDL